jgi:hypothetical protein
MQLNWITVGMMIIVALIAYTGYKVFRLMKTLKTPPVITHEQKPMREYPQEDSPVSLPVTPPKSQPAPVSQPKLAPPAFLRKPPIEEESEEEEIETEMFNLNDETEYNEQQSEMIIPLNLNNIIKQVVNQKMVERTPTTLIKEIDSDTSVVSTSTSRPRRMSDDSVSSSITIVEEEKTIDKTPLNKMTIAELKELAKKNNIKLTEGGKPKNKETLLKELSGF